MARDRSERRDWTQAQASMQIDIVAFLQPLAVARCRSEATSQPEFWCLFGVYYRRAPERTYRESGVLKKNFIRRAKLTSCEKLLLRE